MPPCLSSPPTGNSPPIRPATADAGAHSDFGFGSDFGFRASGFRARRGFTVIELLVVMGIIIVLATFLFYAYQKVVLDRKISDTKTALQSAKALLANYEQATHYRRPPPTLFCSLWGNAQWPPMGTSFSSSFWTAGITSIANAPGAGEPAATAINPDIFNNTNASFCPVQLADTICAMYAIQSIPENQAILNSLPTNLKKTVQVTQSQVTGNNAPVETVTLILDGWGNPLLFAPADGLYGVETSADSTTTPPAGTYPQGQQLFYRKLGSNEPFIYTAILPNGASGAPPYPPPSFVMFVGTTTSFPLTITAQGWGGLCDPTGLRPYWVSGGPDGDVSNTHYPQFPELTRHDDDNIYSFNN